jgi:hypothetical protein
MEIAQTLTDQHLSDGPTVGFMHFEGDCDISAMAILVMDFDTSWLKELDAKLVFQAELRFQQQVTDSYDADLNPVPADSCLGRLSLAPRGWPTQVTRDDLLRTPDAGDERIDAGWLVTRDIQLSLAPEYEFQGFAIHPLDEDLSVERTATCIASLEKIRLWLHYAVL